MDHLDDRPPCPTCSKLMGRHEAAAGLCLWCQRIAAANQAARPKDTP